MSIPASELEYSRGTFLVKQGKIEESITAFTRALEANPRFQKAYNNRGYAKFMLGRLAEALADFDQAILLDANDAVALANRGAILSRMWRVDDALTDLTRAIQLRPNVPQTYSDRAGAYLAQDRFDEAKADLERALALDATCTAAHFHVAALHAKRGDLHGALPHYDRAAAQGLRRAAELARNVRARLFIAANESGSIRKAIEALIAAESEDELDKLIDQYPYTLLPDFYGSFLGDKYLSFPGIRERALYLEHAAHKVAS
jgi:tetratricopeptide (TPR) repeat protein